MRQYYIGALNILAQRISQCGTALQCKCETGDQYAISYWSKEMAIAKFQMAKIHKRLKNDHNVIKVDFLNKKRVA